MKELSSEDFGTLVVCSERYALGRRTYMPSLVCRIIIDHIDDLSDKDISVLISDIERPAFGGYGDDCDKAEWMNLLRILKDRKNNEKF